MKGCVTVNTLEMAMTTKQSFSLHAKPAKAMPIPGFDRNYSTSSSKTVTTTINKHAAKVRQLNALSYSPGKSLLMTGFMLWMSGSTLNIFSIMMTGMALWNPVKSVIGIGTTFSKFDGEHYYSSNYN